MPDGTVSQADVTLGTEEKGTPQQPQTITREEHEKALRDTKTAIMADVGRQKAEADRAMKAAQAVQERVERMIREQEAAELEAYKDDPAELRRIRAEQARKKADDELAKARLELSERDERLKAIETERTEANRTQAVQSVAARLGVDASKLAKLSKFTNGSTEAIEEIAQELPKLNPTPPRNNFQPDSNRSAGGAIQGVTEVQQDYVSGKINAVQYSEKMKALGKQP